VFNPQPQIQPVHIDGEHRAYIIDHALADPHAWVDYAAGHRERFECSAHNAFPGPELPMSEPVAQQLEQFFSRHIRSLLGARRVLRMYSRMALVTAQPEDLEPRQWICHRDRFGVPADQCVGASVLYLFDNPALGGTSFYRPRRSAAETDRLVHDSGVLSGPGFSEKYAIEPGYLSQSNGWFRQVYTVEPRFNRMVFYDGNLFHCSDIPHPEALSADPRRGRLTINGFFTCRRAAS